jgi:hypothetical protein
MRKTRPSPAETNIYEPPCNHRHPLPDRRRPRLPMDDPLSPLARKRKRPDADDHLPAVAAVQDPSAAAAPDQLLVDPPPAPLEAPRRTASTCWGDANPLWTQPSSSAAPPPALVAAEPPSPSSPKRPRTEIGASIPLSPKTPPSPTRKRTRSTPRAPRRMQRHASAPAAVARSVSPPCPCPVDLSSPYIPCLQPLINRETLKELDLEQILRNPQLREFLSPRSYLSGRHI